MDINCDVGEGFEVEAKLMPYIQSCNIACGGHAGDNESMKRVVTVAIKNHVKIGAHPSYLDKESFGRKTINISATQLKKSVKQQINSLNKIILTQGGVLHHIKPHGALYNDIAKDKALALCFLEAITPYKATVKLYVPYKSIVAKQALEQGFSIVYEAFADRNYNKNLSLVSRAHPEALITNPKAVLKHVLQMVGMEKVTVVSGEQVTLKATTFCVHADTFSALDIVKTLHHHFSKKHNIVYKPYGENAVLMEWPQKISKSILNDIRLFVTVLDAENIKEIQETNFVYCSLLLVFNPKLTSYKALKSKLKALYYARPTAKTHKKNTRWQIPVCYDKQFGLDLPLLAAEKKCSKQTIVSKHMSVNYTVYGIGFLPGFLYLGGLDKALFAPRKNTPRLNVPKGSVAIGGEQTGIYPQNSPGGWHIVGKTPVTLFNSQLKNPCTIVPGDEIQFTAITLQEFERIEKMSHYPLKKEEI